MPKWEKGELRLDANHQWKAKRGYSIFVIDRGAVRFDIPKGWYFDPEAKTTTLYDRKPPADDIRLQITVFYLPAGMDWSALPLVEQLEDASGQPDPKEIEQLEVKYQRRPDLELAWRDIRWLDATQNREARTRHLLARGANVQPLITIDFWPEDTKRFTPIWNELIRTLRLGEYVADPRKGAPARRWG